MTPPKGPNQRKKGQGSVYHNAARGRWEGAVSRTVNGKRVRRVVTAATEEEATEKLDALIAGFSAHTIYLPEPLGEKAEMKAASRKETLSDVVRSTVQNYVDE